MGTAEKLEGRGCKLPGPGQHDPDDRTSSRKSSCPSYGMTPRRDPYSDSSTFNPGPGEYLPSSTDPPMPAPCKFGSGPRMLATISHKKTPGPGSYSVDKTCTGHATVADSAPKWYMTARKELELGPVWT